MLRAADRYHLGKSSDGGVIFWQIDTEGRTRDGKIMFYRDDCHRDKSHHPSWVTARMKAYYGYDGDLPVDRCLFGLHLLGHTDPTDLTDNLSPAEMKEIKEMTPSEYVKRSQISAVSAIWKHPSSVATRHSSSQAWLCSRCSIGSAGQSESVRSERSVCKKITVCVVEAEKTAVIMSEVYPQYLWMAAGGLSMLNAEKLLPLRDHHVILFPDTDPNGKAFAHWLQIAKEASRHTLYPVYVSPLLEHHATPEQKAAKIDIVDYLFHPNPSI